jgi:hypothetical protein
MPFIDDNHVVEQVPAEAAIVLQHRSAMVLRKLVRFDLTTRKRVAQPTERAGKEVTDNR